MSYSAVLHIVQRAFFWCAPVAAAAITLASTLPAAAQQSPCAAGQILAKSAGLCMQVEFNKPQTAQGAEQQCATLGMELARNIDLTGVSELKPVAAGKSFVSRTLDRGVYDVIGGLAGWVPSHLAYPAGKSFPYICKKPAPVACRADEIKSSTGNDCLYIDPSAKLAGEAARQLCTARGMQPISEFQTPGIMLDLAERAHVTAKLGAEPFVVLSVGAFKIQKFNQQGDRLSGPIDLKQGAAAATEQARVLCIVKATQRPK